MVVSEVNKITSDGLPVLLIENAPPEIKSPGFQLTRPEIYYGESTQDPVFVHTAREEFDYPSGDDNKYSTYQGSGGFPVGSPLLKAAAAISLGEPNILFTGYLTGQSRMMIYRNVAARLEHLAGFLHWDADPYLVITDDGRLVWMVDGYTTSLAHPYSATIPVAGVDEGANYIRNAVKATVDAYTGKISLYVFDPSDPLIQAYQRLFPKLFQPASAMPADLRRHARYPEVLFSAQAEAYRIFHMRDAQVFYNKEDVWEIARNLYGQSGQPEPMQPTYVVATLPGEKQPEFLLILPFSPRGKDNLIGWMAARSDGDHLGELIYFQLSKQQLMYGPMQIESRIDQDQNISKDLTLWNQQGSHVLRGNIIALPVTGGFLYVESIYIQATEARMPQLKKVVLAMGDRLIYRDTFDQALADLQSGSPPSAPAGAATATAAAATAVAPAAPARTELARAFRAAQESPDAGRAARSGIASLAKANREKVDSGSLSKRRGNDAGHRKARGPCSDEQCPRGSRTFLCRASANPGARRQDWQPLDALTQAAGLPVRLGDAVRTRTSRASHFPGEHDGDAHAESQADPRASLLVTQPDASGDPLGASRVTPAGPGCCRFLKDEAPEARALYLARYANSKYWVDFDDFFFYRMTVVDIYYVGGFGVMGWVPASAL